MTTTAGARRPAGRRAPDAVHVSTARVGGVLVVVCVAVLLDATALATSSATGPEALRSGFAAVAKALGVAATCGTVGALVVSAILLRDGTRRDREALAALSQAASVWAVLWAVTAFFGAAVLVSRAEITGVDAGVATASTVTTGVLATVVAAVARSAPSRARAGVALLLSALAVAATAGAGHAWHADARVLAVGSMTVHVVAISVWLGGLLAVAVHLPRAVRRDARVLAAFSRVALGCFVAVGFSGAAHVLARWSWTELVSSGGYGLILAAKVLLFGVAGVAGALHRRRALPSLVDGDSRPFWRLAAVELVVMAMLLGLGAALSGTAPGSS